MGGVTLTTLSLRCHILAVCRGVLYLFPSNSELCHPLPKISNNRPEVLIEEIRYICLSKKSSAMGYGLNQVAHDQFV